MLIKLAPRIDRSAAGVVVGTMDGETLAFEGRQAVSGGKAYPHAEVSVALVEAVDEAATRVLGPEWSKPLAFVTGLNPRTCNRDRILQWGLPPWAYVMLGNAAATPDPRATGALLVAAARLGAEAGPTSGLPRDPPSPSGDPLSDAHQALDHAWHLVGFARASKALAASARAGAALQVPDPSDIGDPGPAP